MDIFLRYEISARELDAAILTALVAASRGHRVVVCDWAAMMRGILIRNKRSGFVHLNSITPTWRTEIFHSIFRYFGFKISSLDQEAGIQRESFESFADARFGLSSVTTTDIIFCWGPADQEVLQRRYPEHHQKFVVSGSPRVDLWTPLFSRVYLPSKHSSHPRILILSSISGPLSRISLREMLRSHRESGYFERDSGLLDELVGKFKEGAELMLEYRKLVRSLSITYAEATVVIKAHPSEDLDTWREILGAEDNIVIDEETSTSELIRVSDVAITTGSSTAFEAVFSGTPLISFQPLSPQFRQYGFADNLGTVAHSIDEVQDIIDGILSRPVENSHFDQTMSRLRDFHKKIYFDDNELAAERMVLAWEAELEKSKKQDHVPNGSRSAMTSKQLAFYLASAFPVLARLFKFRWRQPGSTPKTNWKRPALDREATLARIEEMKKALDLKQSFFVRFKGKSSLIVEAR